ncbi:MAG: hypothetical protein LBK55_07590 [Azoarcus sp.]|jgi:hypothetical protein|nr:hypothetical protein [Azoarcus sp.]
MRHIARVLVFTRVTHLSLGLAQGVTPVVDNIVVPDGRDSAYDECRTYNVDRERLILNNSSQLAVSTQPGEALRQQLGEAASNLITKNLNIAPTIEIRPGFLFNVVATKDITLPGSCQSFDYTKRSEP